MENIKHYFLGVLFLLASCTRDVKQEFYDTGELRSSVELKNGKPNGLLEEYYPDGKLKSKGEWTDGLSNGTTTSYFPNGKIETISNWKNGKEDGLSKKYSEDGILYSIGKYQNGKREELRIYYKNGKLWEHQLYNVNERIIYLASYDSLNGKIDFSVPPVFYEKNDTIELGDTYEVGIGFGVKLLGNLKVYSGKLVNNVELVDTINVQRFNDSLFSYSIRPLASGKLVLPFVFKYQPTESDSLSVDGMIVKHSIYIQDSDHVEL